MRMYKKGVSPIVATVLLIAFAVSLGTVIMNLGSSLETGICEHVEVEVFAPGGVERLCYNEKTQSIDFTVNNAGDPVDGYRYSITGNKVFTDDVLQPMIELDRTVKSVAVDGLTSLDAFSIIPIVKRGDELVYCTEQVRDYVGISNCK